MIATIGPASKDRKVLADLIQAGVRILRLNFSHGNAESFRQLVADVRELEQETHIPIAILQDLAGPKIRIGSVNNDEPVEVAAGMRFALGLSSSRDMAPQDAIFIPLDNERVLQTIAMGDTLIIADGSLRLSVTDEPAHGFFIVEALNNGTLTSRKGLTVPGKAIPVPALTEKDRKDLVEGLELGVDAVALSFVQTPEDIKDAKEIIHACHRNVPVVAKLERRNAVDRLHEILAVADIIMVARGDLGIECPLSEVPSMQKRIINECNKAGKPVIVATQMLVSMVNSPCPTRAEATDVANAVWDGTDCVMMSEETAMGKYPVEAARTMRDIATHAEAILQEQNTLHLPDDAGPAECLAHAACTIASRIHAKGIVTFAERGINARLLASFKPAQKIFAIGGNMEVVRALNFSWGVHPRQTSPEPYEKHLIATQHYVDGSHHFDKGDLVVLTASGEQGWGGKLFTDTLKIYRK